jgi:hypothetical protein
MKTTSKKIIGGFMVVMLIASIGIVFASANIDDTSDNDTIQKTFCDKRQPSRLVPFDSNLTVDQKTELNDLINTLKEQGSNSSEVRVAIQQKLNEWGILDQQLNNEITQTEQRLQILNREKKLRDQGYSWDEIRNMIQDEFNLQNYTCDDHGVMNRNGFDRKSCRGPCDFMFGEESD